MSADPISILLIAVLFGYPVLQAWALWRCRGGWGVGAWAVLLTAGLGYR